MIYLLACTSACALLLFFYGLSLRYSVVFNPLSTFIAEDSAAVISTKLLKKKGIKGQFFIIARRYAPFAKKYHQLSELITPTDINQRLARAGNPMQLTEDDFIGTQIAALGLMTIVGLYIGLIFAGISLWALIIGIVIGASGASLAVMVLNSVGKKRQIALSMALPDTVELISTSVAAGIDIDRAIMQIIENSSGPLRDELKRFLDELQLGIPRQDAYHNLLWRNNADDLHSFINALMQGQTLGVPVTRTLYEHTDAMRERRLQRAKEAGAKASPQISLVTTLIIAPSVFTIFVIVMVYKLFLDFGVLWSAAGG
ncbi:MAG: type II secretion system F family protein [Bdellovibrionales bacterium]|nr:type II secretion system F family protein [Bdellovibrionales bacterium]